MRKSLKALALSVTLLVTGCQLSPSQRYGTAAVTYGAAVSTIVANQSHLSDETLVEIEPAVTQGKLLLDQAYENLTDGDVTNDKEVQIILDALENKILPALEVE